MRYKDLSNMFFGRWSVIGYAGSRDRQSLWNCRCSCGTEREVTSSSLNSGKSKSCGCLHIEILKKHRKPVRDVVANLVYKKYIGSARTKGLIFDLNMNAIWNIVQSECYYYGRFPHVNTIRESYQYAVNGIDRINSTKGYTEDNIVSCCRDCNYMKGSISKYDFIRHVSKILDYFFNGSVNKTQHSISKRAVNSLYARYRYKAADKGIGFSLDKNEFEELVSSSCFYCGDPGSNTIAEVGTEKYNGVDRIDNSKSYVKNNVVPCCSSCNYFKRDMPFLDFLRHLKQIQTTLYSKGIVCSV